MMQKRRDVCSSTFVFSALLLLVFLLSACDVPGFPSGNPQATNTPQLTRGGTWIDELSGDPDSLIPNGATSRVSSIIEQAIYAPLFYGDANGTLHPGLAQAIPTVANGGISADLQTWTFHLRPHLTWSDGTPLDANDVDFTWKLWTNANFSAANTYGLDLITSTEILDNNLTIVFHLKHAFAPFLSLWADGQNAPLPAHHFNTMNPAQILHSADNLNPSITSGPFIMSESLPGNHYTVIRNPRYYRAAEGLPYLDKVIFRVATDAGTALKAFQSGKVDSGWFTDLTNVSTYQQLTKYMFVENPRSTNFEAVYFNFRNPMLAQHLEVREAIAMAIDRRTLMKSVRHGHAIALCTDHSAALQPGYQADAPCPTFDLNAANALLDQNGWSKGSDGYRTKGNLKLEFHYSTATDNTSGVANETLIQQNLQAIGIKIDIQNYPPLTFYSVTLLGGVPGTYDIAEFENSFNYDADDSSLFSCGQVPPNGFNIDFYCNKHLDDLYTQELSTSDAAARQDIFNQIHQLYLTDFPFIALYSPLDFALAKKGTHDYLPAPQGALEAINIWQWWCDNGRCPA